MPKQNSEFVTVYVAAERVEAEIVRGRLTTEDVPAFLAYESVGQTWGLIGGLGQVEVRVSQRYAAQARAILQVAEPTSQKNRPTDDLLWGGLPATFS